MSTTSKHQNIAIQKGYLPLMEHFYTIQGEGFNTGKAAYFLRLGGCDVGCVWCDVKDSWEADKHPQVSLDEMIGYVNKANSPHVVITGGEPLMHDLTQLTHLLQAQGIQTWIETSGAHQLSGTWDWVCLSPKKFKMPLDSVYPYANELKIIVYNKTDFDWAKQQAAKVTKACKLYIQPEWSKEKEMLPLIIDFVKQHPEWTISLQTHKYLNIP